MQTTIISQLEKVLGPPAISYILNVPDAQITSLIQGDTVLDDIRQKVLVELNNWINRAFETANQSNDPQIALYFALGSSHLTGSQHFFNQLRRKAGGDLPEPLQDAEVVRTLTSLAIEIYPNLLISPPESNYDMIRPNFMKCTPPYNHPDRPAFERAVLEDSDLALLFPQRGTTAMETYGFVNSSTGWGGSIQLASFASTILTNAYILMRLHGELDPSAFFQNIKTVINLARIAARRGEVITPVFFGFRNVTVPTQIKTEFGTIRPARPADAEFLPRELYFFPGTGRYFDGFVLEAECPCSYRINSEVDLRPASIPFSDRDRQQIQDFGERVTQIQEKIALAIALAIDRKPPVGISFAWMKCLDPLSNGSAISFQREQRAAVPRYVFTRSDCEGLLKWKKLVQERKDDAIKIAIRRILSALSRREDPVDGFVDAIIAWENLFGAGSGELTFRITMAMAHLLEDNYEKRLPLQKELKDQYDTRSRIIHGETVPSHQEATAARDDALERILQCLRKLYLERQDLIADKDRTRKILLT